jgi:predicted DNA-binding protein (MmcQ/YjbR family)
MIAVIEDDKVVGVTPFKEARNSRRIKVGDRYYTITVEREDVVMLRIRCSKDTYVRFRKLMTMFTDEEEALKYLLDLHDAYGKMY